MGSDVQSLAEEIAVLGGQMGEARDLTAAFGTELTRMQDSLVYTGREVGSLTAGIGGGLRRAFDGVVFDGMKLSDALRGVAQSLASTAYNVAMRPVQQAAGGVVAEGLNNLLSGLMPFAKGGAFSQGRVMPFAKGGVVSSPVHFPMRGGTGLMGEAGPEAILPLTRGPDGRLGVQAGAGARPVSVVMNVVTPDVAGFARSQSQIAALATRALSRGQRNG